MKLVILVLALSLTACAGDQVIGRYNNQPHMSVYATNTSYFYDNDNNPQGYMNSYK